MCLAQLPGLLKDSTEFKVSLIIVAMHTCPVRLAILGKFLCASFSLWMHGLSVARQAPFSVNS